MKLSTFLIVAIILGFAQVTCINYFSIFQIKPDLFLLIVFIAALFFELRYAITVAVLTGIFKASFGMGAVGIDILLFSLWSFLIIKISRKISIDDSLTRVLLFFVIALLQNISTGVILIYLGNYIPFGIFLRIVLLSSLYTAIFLPLVLKLAKAKI